MYSNLALSKSILSFCMISLISFLEVSSNPPLVSLLFSEMISKLLEWRPFSRSSAKESFRRIRLLKRDCSLRRSSRNLAAGTVVSMPVQIYIFHSYIYLDIHTDFGFPVYHKDA